MFPGPLPFPRSGVSILTLSLKGHWCFQGKSCGEPGCRAPLTHSGSVLCLPLVRQTAQLLRNSEQNSTCSFTLYRTPYLIIFLKMPHLGVQAASMCLLARRRKSPVESAGGIHPMATPKSSRLSLPRNIYCHMEQKD